MQDNIPFTQVLFATWQFATQIKNCTTATGIKFETMETAQRVFASNVFFFFFYFCKDIACCVWFIGEYYCRPALLQFEFA